MTVRTTVGFIGAGGIATALAKGFCGSADFAGKICVYDPDRERAESLRALHPDIVSVAGSNQELVDGAEFIFPALLPHVLEQVVSPLRFRPENRILHLSAGMKLETVRPWFAPAASVVRTVPLPFASRRIGPVVLFGDDEPSERLLSLLGSVVKVATEHDLGVLASVTGLMAPYYALMGEIVKWCVSRDMRFDDALEYTNRMCETLSELMRQDCTEGIEHIERFVQESTTPLGFNEQALNMLRERGAYAPWIEALDKIGERCGV